MLLKILLPFQVFLETSGVIRIVADAVSGSFGLLPNRLDCVAPLTAGILTYQLDSGPECYVAVDEGVLVKTGANVLVSVRRAIGGVDLKQLRDRVKHEFLELDKQEQEVRIASEKLELGFLRRFERFQHE
jgi:F-type H+-transporting ATPase subunit epsilon